MRLALGCLSLAAAFATVSASAAEPAVVASIRPVHSLVSGVMHGLGEPSLLVPPGASPHSFALRPGDAMALQNADVVFYVGGNLETFLEKPLTSLADKAKVVDLQKVPGVAMLPLRAGGWWGEHAHEHDDDHADHDSESAADPHVWLDPANARAWIREIARTLAELDPANASTYSANAADLGQRLDQLIADLESDLADLKNRPYLVFHDAYQYFENRFGLNAVGSIVVNPESEPGAQRISELRAKVRDTNAACIFAEPQFEPKLVATVVEGTPTRIGTLDPVGTDLSDGPDLYFDLLRNLSGDLRACLAP